MGRRGKLERETAQADSEHGKGEKEKAAKAVGAGRSLRQDEGAKPAEAIEHGDGGDGFAFQGQVEGLLRLGGRREQAGGPAALGAVAQDEEAGVRRGRDAEGGGLLLAEKLAARGRNLSQSQR